MSLAQRSLRSVTWTTTATWVGLPVNFIQSILLARLLPVEYFGIIAGVGSLVMLSSTFFELGFTNAFLHRAAETEAEDQAARAFFTLRLFSESLWFLLLILVAVLAFSDLRRFTLIVMALGYYLNKIALTPRVLLARRVEHRRLALMDLIIGLVSALVSVAIALAARSIWSLLISIYITLAVNLVGLYLWRPFWKPRLLWDGRIFRYYLNFGGRNLVNNLFDSALDNFDNLWTNVFLGDLKLGFYSRAFKFAIYPRLILSTPVNSVVVGTYSELKYDRHRLSRAFFQTNAFLIRAGFLLAGWLAVIAPAFIRLLIGERWLPMLDAFRLMLIFALLDPIKVSVSSVLMAVGKPEKITIARLAQVVVLAAGLFTLGFRFEIAGVALAMDLMIVVGTLLLLHFVRAHVDVSYWRLFLAPFIALAAGLGLGFFGVSRLPPGSPDALALLTGTLLFGAGYLALLFALEGRTLLAALKEYAKMSFLPGKGPQP